ncbi:hypothetical protein A2U01_0014715, partial [Trifolium medium]|nr:hypothetical protein [Trifolium medium]
MKLLWTSKMDLRILTTVSLRGETLTVVNGMEFLVITSQ